MVTIALVSMVTKGIVQVPEIYVELLKDKKTLAKEDSQKISKGEIFLLKELNLKDIGDTFEIQWKNEKFAKKVTSIGQSLSSFAKKRIWHACL